MVPIGIGAGLNLASAPHHIIHKVKKLPEKVVSLTPVAAQKLAIVKLKDYGWNATQYVCLNKIWTAESHWNFKAVSKTHDHGIPQRNMPLTDYTKTEIHKFQTDPVGQINWGLNYIHSRYGTPCRAWNFHLVHGWY